MYVVVVGDVSEQSLKSPTCPGDTGIEPEEEGAGEGVSALLE